MPQIKLLSPHSTAAERLSRPYSPAVRAGDFVFVSGQVPVDAQGELVGGSIENQTRQVFENLKKALALGGCALTDVCKVNVWLADARDFAAFNRAYMQCFGDHRPARSTVESRLMVGALLEVDVTAWKPA